MNKSSFGSTMLSFLMAFALLWEASGHMHDVITSLATTADGEWLFVRSRFWLLRSQDKGNTFIPLRNPNNINWDRKDTPGGAPNFILSPDFKNDTTLIYKQYLSTDAGQTWSINLQEKLERRKWGGVQFELCAVADPTVFSSKFANDGTIFTIACHQEEPTLATLLYSEDFGENFSPVQKLKAFEFGSWLPILTTTTDEIFLQRNVGPDSEIFTPTSGDPKKWKRFKTLKNFEIQSITEDRASDDLLVIDRNSQTLHRLNQDKKLTPITLPSAATATSGDQFLLSAHSHKGVGNSTSLVVLRSTCQNREFRLRQLGVECPSTGPGDEDQREYILLSTDEGTTWKNLTIKEWFCAQGGGTSTNFKLPEFTHVTGIPGTPTVYLGAYNGLYRSEDNGESWLELDTIARDITGMNAVKISPDNIQLSLCTYDESCWYGDIDIGGLRDGSISRLPEGSLKKVIRSSEEFEVDEPGLENFLYSTIGFSDGVGFLSDKIGVMRYGNGFNGTYTKVDSITNLPTPLPASVPNKDRVCVQGIGFSPNFENDDTVFIGGWNIGVFRSLNRGLSFEKVFDPTTQPEVPNGAIMDTVGLIVSPDFASNGVVFTYVTDGTKDKEDGLLYISENFGSNWTAVDQGEDPPRMVSLTLAIDNADNRKSKYSLLGNDKYGDVWVNRRVGQAIEFGRWEPLRYKVNGEFITKIPENSVAGKGFGHESILGTPDGKLYMGMLTGGVAYGKLNTNKFLNPKGGGLKDRFRFGGLGQAYKKELRRTYFEAIIEIEGVLFGSFSSEIWTSLDEGKTWTSIYSIPPREPRFSGCEEGNLVNP